MIAEFAFLLFVVLAAAGALLMVISRNPVASLMYLVLNLFALAGLFVLLDAHFLAAVQVIVYAGAIMVLFLFVIMLLNLGHQRGPEIRGMFAHGVGLVLGSAMFAAVGTALGTVQAHPATGGPAAVSATDALLASRGAVAIIAEPLFRDFMVPFEVTSLLLLVAVVGAIVLARRQVP